MKRIIFFLVTMLLPFSIAFGQIVWFSLDSGTTAHLRAIAVSTDFYGVAVGDEGTLLQSQDGANWDLVDIGTELDLYAVQYVGDETFIAAGAQGIILRSTDNGSSWEIVQQADQEYSIYGLSIDTVSGNGLAGGSGNTIITTNDFGMSWQFYEGGYMNSYYCAHMPDSQFGVVFGTNAIFQGLAAYTNDGGQSFSYQPYYPTSGNIGYEGQTVGSYFFSNTFGFTVGALWSGQGFITTEVNWDDQFWAADLMPEPLTAIRFLNDSRGAVAGSNGYIAETTDGGLSWEQVNTEAGSYNLNDVLMIGNTGYAVGEHGTILNRQVMPGFADHTHLYKIECCPQPAKNYCRIKLPVGSAQEITLRITDISGRQLHDVIPPYIYNVSGFFEIPTAALPAGTYVLNGFADGMYFNTKILVQ